VKGSSKGMRSNMFKKEVVASSVDLVLLPCLVLRSLSIRGGVRGDSLFHTYNRHPMLKGQIFAGYEF
jgi:hypothetical protein